MESIHSKIDKFNYYNFKLLNFNIEYFLIKEIVRKSS